MALQVGDKAPDFTLESDSGDKVKLSSLRGKKVILFFYPKDDTAGCTKQACGMRDNYPEIQGKNGIVLGISADSVDSHIKFKKKYNFPFPLLSDPDHHVIQEYGAWGEKMNYGKKYMGIIRSHVLVDEKGRIAEIHNGIKPDASIALAVEQVNR
jgi:peroxiredoxin Q/BCP